MRLSLLLIAVLVAACAPKPQACPTVVAPAATPTPPTPVPTAAPATNPPPSSALSAEMQQLAYFLGTWQCAVEAFPFKVIPGGKYESTIDVTDILGGRWNEIHNESERASVAAFTGWDDKAHHYVRMGVDSRGNQEAKTSDGWKGDDWLWVGTFALFGKDYPMHHTITRQGDGAFVGKYELEVDGTWTVIRQERCTK